MINLNFFKTRKLHFYKYNLNRPLPTNQYNKIIKINRIEDFKYKIPSSYKNQILKELSLGSVLYLIEENEEVCAYIFCSNNIKNIITELNIEIELSDSTYYAYAANTIEKYRNKGLYGFLLNHLINQHFNNLFIAVEDNNLISLRKIENAGFIRYFSLLKTRSYFKNKYILCL